MVAKYKYAIHILSTGKNEKVQNAASYKKIYCKCGREYRIVPEFEKNARRGMVWRCSSCGYDITAEFILKQLKIITEDVWEGKI